MSQRALYDRLFASGYNQDGGAPRHAFAVASVAEIDPASVVELGAGAGYVARELLRSSGIERYTIADLSDYSGISDKRVSFVRVDVESSEPLPSITAECAVCTDMLEHVPLRAAIASVRWLLECAPVLVATTAWHDDARDGVELHITKISPDGWRPLLESVALIERHVSVGMGDHWMLRRR